MSKGRSEDEYADLAPVPRAPRRQRPARNAKANVSGGEIKVFSGDIANELIEELLSGKVMEADVMSHISRIFSAQVMSGNGRLILTPDMVHMIFTTALKTMLQRAAMGDGSASYKLLNLVAPHVDVVGDNGGKTPLKDKDRNDIRVRLYRKLVHLGLSHEAADQLVQEIEREA